MCKNCFRQDIQSLRVENEDLERQLVSCEQQLAEQDLDDDPRDLTDEGTFMDLKEEKDSNPTHWSKLLDNNFRLESLKQKKQSYYVNSLVVKCLKSWKHFDLMVFYNFTFISFPENRRRVKKKNSHE